MKRSPREQGILALSIVFVAVPFAFALIRAVRTGYDLRYFWAALASLLGAAAVMAVGKGYGRRPHVAVALSAGAFVVATICAVLAALFLGTSVSPGSLMVGSAFGFCCAVSLLLHTLAR